MSEAELHLLKARLRGGQLSKARRGELVSPLPIGLIYDLAGKVVLDPDTAVQQAIHAVFQRFDATGSATATVKAFNAEGLRLPRRLTRGPDKGKVLWAPAEHSRILHILHNPRYASAFFYGRYQHKPSLGTGKSGPRLQPRDQWVAFFPDHHPGYITLEKYDQNQAKLTSNATAHGKDRRHGPPREGPALLQGIAVCGICGRRMTVRYHQRKDRLEPEYVCQAKDIQHGNPICQRVHGAVVDQAIGQLLVTALTPLALQAALAVANELTARADEADRLRSAAVEGARHKADLARRRYLAVDPDNRLAISLETDWNQALRDLKDATDAYEQATNSGSGTLDETQRARITALAGDFPRLWAAPDTPVRERKRMVRLLVTDVTLTRGEQITAHVRLHGGQEHTLVLPVPLASWQIRQTPPEIVTAIDELLDDHTDGQVAQILTTRGHVSGSGRPIHARIVRQIRDAYHLRSHPQRLCDQGLFSLNEISRRLGVHTNTVKRWRDAGLLAGRRANDKGEFFYQFPGPEFRRPRTGRPPRPRPAPDETPVASTERGAV